MGNTEARPPGRPPKETAEFRSEAVRLVEERGQSLSAATLQRWVQHAKVEAGEGPAGA